MKEIVQNSILILTALVGFGLMEEPKNFLDAVECFRLAFVVSFCGAILFIFIGMLLEGRSDEDQG